MQARKSDVQQDIEKEIGIESQSYFDQFKSLNSHYNTIAIGARHGFYSFSFFNELKIEKYYRGWKLHLSVEKGSVKQAYDCVAPILLDNFDIFDFKVVDVSLTTDKRFTNGAQFTIYLYQDGIQSLASEERLNALLKNITETLQSAGIKAGEIPESDRKTHYPYFSLRNDGDKVLTYYSAADAGVNYNPYNLPCVFDFLLPKVPDKTFNLQEHFDSFCRHSDEQLAQAFIATYFALMIEYIKPEHAYKINTIKNEFNFEAEDSFYVFREYLLEITKANIHESDLNLLTLCLALGLPGKFDEEVYSNFKMQLVVNFIKNIQNTMALNSYMNIFIYSLKQSLLTSAENTLLHDLNKLMSSMPIKAEQTDDNSNSGLLCLFYQSPQIYLSDNEFTEKSRYLKSISKQLSTTIRPRLYNLNVLLKHMSCSQLLELDEERQVLIIYYADKAVSLVNFGVTLEKFKAMPLDVMFGLLSNHDKVVEFCESLKITLDDLLNYNKKSLLSILSNPEKAKSEMLDSSQLSLSRRF